MIVRNYRNLALGDGKQIDHQTHYRTAGSGSPLILLHPSPLSSAFMCPLIDLLKGQVRVFAPDTPGYGQSDALAAPAKDLSPYVEWLAAFIRSNALDSVGIYGSATGAQIAIQFARQYPDMTDYLILDNAVHFTDEERQEIPARYFPDMNPKDDGEHLQMAWKMSSKLFSHFPWFSDSEENRISSTPAPTALVHATALAYLNSGADYHQAYRAAFLNEDAKNMQAVTRPTNVIRWAGSILKKYADRLDGYDWPEHINMVHCSSEPESRFAAISSSVSELLARR
jgi:pimeloyl-ACP methyl ester carboxylesterase